MQQSQLELMQASQTPSGMKAPLRLQDMATASRPTPSTNRLALPGIHQPYVGPVVESLIESQPEQDESSAQVSSGSPPMAEQQQGSALGFAQEQLALPLVASGSPTTQLVAMPPRAEQLQGSGLAFAQEQLALPQVASGSPTTQLAAIPPMAEQLQGSDLAIAQEQLALPQVASGSSTT